ncbi:hypothetical protein SDC9_178555 [bioreactor metagenome]|uniref:Uncharacterized protein n=1 Tax=bioreactor metagenome TaxID=1076179 RepID=A0A645GW23_9ZZZZ
MKRSALCSPKVITGFVNYSVPDFMDIFALGIMNMTEISFVDEILPLKNEMHVIAIFGKHIFGF